MNEYISREAALDVIREVSERYADESLAEFAYNVVINIPTADVQPVRRGKWKQVSTQVDEYNNHLYECTACRATDRHNINVNVPYCWHCGAKMDGDTR